MHQEDILIISPTQIYPPHHGGASRVFGIASALAEVGKNVTVLCVHRDSLVNRRAVSIHGIRYLEWSIFRPSTWRLLTASTVIEFEWPMMPYMMLFARMFGKHVVLDEHGVEYQFWNELSKLHSFTERPQGHVRRIARLILGSRFSMYLRERIAIGLSRNVIVVSEQDLHALASLYNLPTDRFTVIPNCASTPSHMTASTVELPERYVVFLGSFGHPPNAHGAMVTVNEILPMVAKQTSIPFVFIGPNPPHWLQELSDNTEIFVLGEVDAVEPYLLAATMAICPIWHGSGTRVKLLDYMRCGLPTVSTRKGAEGLDVSDGSDILLADSPSDFAASIIRLDKDRDAALRLGRAASGLVERQYSWKAQLEKLLTVYNS